VVPDGERPVIESAREWLFTFDRRARRGAAVRRAARFVRANAALFPPSVRAGSATAAAVLAVKAYPVFMAEVAAPPEQLVRRMLELVREFDAAQ
jgi:hypothetical protein